MYTPRKTPEQIQAWIDEAKETAANLRKFGLEDAAIGWDKVAEQREKANYDQ
jgi:hypothetical protein